MTQTHHDDAGMNPSRNGGVVGAPNVVCTVQQALVSVGQSDGGMRVHRAATWGGHIEDSQDTAAWNLL